jgi:multidrug efflux pump subunit AcrA (membrane-fusion protein)
MNMNTTTTTAESPTSTRPARQTDALQSICNLTTECRSVPAFYRGVLEVVNRQFAAVFASMHLSNATESLEEQWSLGDDAVKGWERLTQAGSLEAQADGVALARLYRVDRTDNCFAVMSMPLRDDRGHTGVVTVVAACPDRSHAERLLAELRTLVYVAGTLARTVRTSRSEAKSEADQELRAIARSSRFASLTELAFAVTNGLKTKFHCDQVVLGKVDRGRVRILSMSSFDATYPRSPGCRLIQQAMEECLDFGQRIESGNRGDWSDPQSRRDHRLHRQWRAAIGDAAVASVPINVEGQCVAVLSLVRPGTSGFQSGELEEVQRLASAYGPALQLVARAGRSWWAQTRDTIQANAAWLLAPKRMGRKVVAALSVLLAIWFCFGSMTYRISMPCQVVPTKLQHFGAPFEGVLQAALVEPGDSVTAGQLLLTMDTRELELQKSELQSEAAVAELELAQAAAQQNVAAAAAARARLAVVQSSLDSVVQRIELAEVRAPVAGTIMAGEAKYLVGDVVPLGRTLLEFAPHDEWAVELRVAGRDGTVVQGGQVGSFVTVANPDQPLACQVDRVQPTATAWEGKHVFLARARMTDAGAWNLAGMEGVATLEVGPRRVWWITLHRVVDFVRLNFWV